MCRLVLLGKPCWPFTFSSGGNLKAKGKHFCYSCTDITSYRVHHVQSPERLCKMWPNSTAVKPRTPLPGEYFFKQARSTPNLALTYLKSTVPSQWKCASIGKTQAFLCNTWRCSALFIH